MTTEQTDWISFSVDSLEESIVIWEGNPELLFHWEAEQQTGYFAGHAFVQNYLNNGGTWTYRDNPHVVAETD